MKTKTPLHRIAAFFALALLATFSAMPEAKAQYQITTLGGSITENFTNYNGTAAPTTGNWIFNSNNTTGTKPGFSGQGTGTSSTGNVWSYGVANDSDRALGFLGSTSAGQNMNAFAEVQNKITSGTVTSLVVTWSGEMWRRITTATSAITVAYAIGAQGTTDAATLGGLSWTNLNTYTPTMGANANGSLLNSQSFNSGTVSLASFSNAQSIYIRVYYLGGSGSRAGLAIDDLSVTFNGTAPPAGSDLYWTANGSTLGGAGTWATSGNNWSADVSPVSGATWDGTKKAIFTNSPATVTVATVTASAGIQFATDGYTLSSGTLTLGGASAADNTITTDAGVNATINSVLDGANGLTKAGDGNLTLGGANTYIGGITVSGGRLIGTTGSLLGNIANNAAVTFNQNADGTYTGVMSGSGSLVKDGTGTVTLSGANTYNGGTLVSAGRLVGTTTSLQGAITNNAAVTFDQNTDGTYGGVMSGSGSLTKAGTGTTTLSGANTYGGGTLVSGGRLVGTTTSLQGNITNNAAVTFNQSADGTYSGVMSGSGSLVKDGTGTTTLSGANTYNGGTLVSAGRLVGTTTSLQGAITNNAAVTFNQSTAGAYNGVMSGSGALAKAGSGTVTLGGNNSSYSGTIDLQAGGLIAANNNALGSSAVTLNNGSIHAANGVTLANNFTIGATGGRGADTTLQAWNFFGESSPATSDADVIQLDLNTAPELNLLTRGSGAGASSASNSFRTTGFQNNGISTANTDYFEWSVASADGSSLFLSSLDARFAGTGTFRALPGVSAQFAYSLDGQNFTLIGSPFSLTADTAMPTIDLTGISALQDLDSDSTVTFRYYASGQTTTGGWGFNSPSASEANDGLKVTGFAGATTPTGSGTLGISEAGTATFSGNIVNNNEATLTAAAGGTATFSGAVSGDGTLNKTGAGTVTLSGASANTFTGMTTVSAGTLQLDKTAGTDALAGNLTVNSGAVLLISASNQVNDSSAVSLSGGTITRGSGVSEVFGNLNLTDASFLDFGSGTAGTLSFGTYSTPSALLTVNNFFQGNTLTFGSDLSGSINNASFFAFDNGFTSSWNSGTSTFTITAIPEPSTYLAAAGLLSLMLWPSRKRIIRDTKKILGLTPPMRDRLARRASELRAEV